MMRRRVLIWGLAGSATMLAAVAVYADVKVYSGVQCIEVGSSAPSIRYSTANVFNNSASNKNVICPVIKDFVDIQDWNVTVNRNGFTGAWGLTLINANVSGTSGNTNGITVPAISGVLSVQSSGGALAFETSGQIFISTALPPAARIHSYLIDEKFGGDTF